MADGGFTLDVGSAAPWAEQKVLALFGKDFESVQRRQWLQGLHETAVELTQFVKCIGMHRPVPFDNIYQPTKLKFRSGLEIQAAAAFSTQNRMAQSIALSQSRIHYTRSVDEFIDSPENAIVFAGPGWGKTTFLHHIFRKTSSDKTTYAVLITLRRPTAVDDLEQFVELISKKREKYSKVRVLLLVDGYDEITLTERRRVSDALLQFSATRAGRFILTCREHYEVIGLSAAEVFISSFDLQDKYRFVTAFLSVFQSSLDPIGMVNELEDRDMSDFLSHPLLLALACIVKSGKFSEQPRSALRLLDRALMTLQYTWDMDKGIERQPLTELDGGDRMQILKTIAFGSRSPFVPSHRAEATARKCLDKLQIAKADPVLVLKETAQFYGILVPSADGWEFVHRSIQDYLAAKHWVESGTFANEKQYGWETRTAYAACISGDATTVIVKALAVKEGLTCAIETLMNGPDFDQTAVARAIVQYYSQGRRVTVIEYERDAAVSGDVDVDLFSYLSRRFLNFLVEKLSNTRSGSIDVLIGYCLAELRRKKLRLDNTTYAAFASAFPNPKFQFRLGNDKFVTPEMVRPYSDPPNI